MHFQAMVVNIMIGVTVVCLFVAVILAGIIKTLVKNLLLRHELRLVPGWKGLPLVGCTLEMKSDPVEYFQQITSLCERNSDAGITSMWIGTMPFVVVYRAHTVEELYKSKSHTRKYFNYLFLIPWLGEGLLVSNGDKWFGRRRLITPTFHFKILEEFAQVFNEQATILVRLLKTKVNGPGFDIQPYIYHCMLDVICVASPTFGRECIIVCGWPLCDSQGTKTVVITSGDEIPLKKHDVLDHLVYRPIVVYKNDLETAMGVKIHAQEQTESEVVKTMYRESELVVHRMKYPWLWPDCLYQLSPTGRQEKINLKILHGFTRKVIADRKMELQRQKIKDVVAEKSGSSSAKKAAEENSDDEQSIYLSKKRRLAFLDMLLEVSEQDPSLTDSGIREEVDTFMFEGHDTTAAGAVWILYMLACYPELQVKVQAEVDSIFGDSDGDVTMEDAGKLSYTECFIKETFRLYPPVVWFGRETSEDCQIGKFSIPKGCSVMVMNNILHRDPEYFPDPEKFDPDRWLSDGVTSRHPYCYTPFSAGLRNCIGQRFAMLEEKVVICHLMRNFTVTTTVKRDDIAVFATMILKPTKPVPIQLTARK